MTRRAPAEFSQQVVKEQSVVGLRCNRFMLKGQCTCAGAQSDGNARERNKGQCHQVPASESCPELVTDVLDRIWSHLPIRDLVRMSVVCKSWQASVCAFSAAMRKQAASSVEAPDSLHDDRLSEPQLLLRCVKRALLLQNFESGAPLETDSESFRVCCPCHTEEPCKRFAYKQRTLGQGQSCDRNQGLEDIKTSRVTQSVILPKANCCLKFNSRLEVLLCRSARYSGEYFRMVSEECPIQPGALAIQLMVRCVRPVVFSQWMDAVVVALAQGLPARLPDASLQHPLGRWAHSIK